MSLDVASAIAPGDIVCRPATPHLHYRVFQARDDWAEFYRVTKSGRRDRRETGFSGSLHGWQLVRKGVHTSKCQKCGGDSPIYVGGRCPACNPFLACQTQGCLGDLKSDPRSSWMNRFVCDSCGLEVSR